MQNYYAILGVTIDADQVVIKAAYRALCKKYHPDLYKEDQEFATEKMKEINNAYDVLFNKEKRVEYDRSMGGDVVYSEEEISRSFSPDHEEPIEKDWNFAIDFYPKISKEYEHLRQISIDLAHAYKLVIVEYKLYDKHQETAKNLENNYLEKYFGSHDKIKNLARAYILEGNRAAAKELNKAVNFFGSNINSTVVCEGILKTYPITNTGWEDIANLEHNQRFIGGIDLEEAGKLYENLRDFVIKWRAAALTIVIMLILIFTLNPG